ncbi:flagellar hook protein FlgE [Tropicimonas sp.]|uniref:flagellar hook protein FlgE n=1 Tax=Tropicimonas sp. TaxID=2067044 RepID=UPI003A87EDF7
MSISSSLNASVAGLSANATRLATISDNIANSSTYGYKRAEADFHSMVIDSGNGGYTAGGVGVSTTRMIDQAGPRISTSNATDISVNDRGFIPVTTQTALGKSNGDLPLQLATTGSFRTDENGVLKTTSGLVLLGWPAASDGTIPNYPRDTGDALVPVQINLNQSAVEPTTEMTLCVNLPATETEAGASGDPLSLSVEYYDNLGASQTITATYTPTVPAGATDPATNTWTLTLTDSASSGAVIGEYTLVFDDSRTAGGTLASVTLISGGAYDPASGVISASVAGGPLDITIGAVGDSSGMTQLSGGFSPIPVSKNGSPVGNLTSVEIDANGYVSANFDNGISRVIFQIPLVDVPNPNGLISLDNQSYQISRESGGFFLWNAGDGPTGDIVSYSLEESSTDVADELTSLIQTQRAYSSNAKVIQTVDEMLQETANIKR